MVNRKVWSYIAFVAVLSCFIGSLFGGLLGRNNSFSHWLNPADQTEALTFLDAIKQRNYRRIQAMIDPSAAKPTQSQIDAIAKLIPDGSYSNLQTVSAFSNFQLVPTHDRKVSMAFELTYPHSWLYVTAMTLTKNGRSTVYGIGVYSLNEPLEESNRFLNGNPGTLGIVVALVSIALIAFVIWTMIVCLRSSIPRKPLWIVIAAIGLCRITVDWSDGHVSLALINLMIPAAELCRSSAFSPWTFVASIPIGAILFWKLYGSRTRNTAPQPIPNVETAQPS